MLLTKIAAVLCASASALSLQETYEKLPALGASPTEVTVSGKSAGCSAAHYVHIIFSKTIKGAYLNKCAPYWTRLSECKSEDWTQEMALERSRQVIKENTEAGSIDKTENIKDSAVYIVSGQKDTIVLPKNQFAQKTLYEELGVTKLNFNSLPIGHGMLSDTTEKALYWIYDQLGMPLNPKGKLESLEKAGTEMLFDQHEFVDTTNVPLKKSQVKEYGRAYIPHTCKEKQCKVHMFLHGCRGNTDLDWKDYGVIAATNDLIMLFPTQKCWDNEGYVDKNWFTTKKGVWPSLFKNILDRVTTPVLFHKPAECAEDKPVEDN